MDAGAERDVPVVLAIEDHLVGVVELPWITIRRGERHQDPITGVHRAALELGVVVDDAGHGDRRVRP